MELAWKSTNEAELSRLDREREPRPAESREMKGNHTRNLADGMGKWEVPGLWD